MSLAIVRDMGKREFFIGLCVTVIAFLISYHLPRVINRNV